MAKDQLTVSPQQNRTKKHLQIACIELIKEKGFQAVTVTDIVDYAAYNRSTFYVHYQDKFELAEELLDVMLTGLLKSISAPYRPGQKVATKRMGKSHFQIVSYIYKKRHFFELIKVDDTLPGLISGLEQTILTIYRDYFKFKTINNTPVNMDYFTEYTAYGFCGLLKNWIRDDFRESEETFIQNVSELAATHIEKVEFVGEKFFREGD